MKFAAAVVVLALVVSANASAIPLALSWANQWQPSIQIAQPIVSGWGWPAAGKILTAPAWNVPAAVDISPNPVVVVKPVQAAPAVVVAHATPIEVEGQYVAANRGSVHVAPLPGHIQSAKSLNLQPAPGTW